MKKEKKREKKFCRSHLLNSQPRNHRSLDEEIIFLSLENDDPSEIHDDLLCHRRRFEPTQRTVPSRRKINIPIYLFVYEIISIREIDSSPCSPEFELLVMGHE